MKIRRWKIDVQTIFPEDLCNKPNGRSKQLTLGRPARVLKETSKCYVKLKSTANITVLYLSTIAYTIWKPIYALWFEKEKKYYDNKLFMTRWNGVLQTAHNF